MSTVPVILFRVFALAEAGSWLGLLAGMYLKHIERTTELGVKIFGPVHGALFVAYAVVVLVVAASQRWNLRLTAIALVSAVPPLTTVVFERWANSRGHLSPVARQETSPVDTV